MIIQEPLGAAIWHCLNNYDFRNAVFLAERLSAEVDSDDTVFLLATCYYRAGKIGQAYSLLQKKGVVSPQSRYLLARCCIELDKLSDAEYTLLGPDSSRPNALDDMVTEFGDQACFALQILAVIYKKTERRSQSAEAYRRALKLNPFLWSAFEDLCNNGESPDPIRTFQVSHLDNFTMCQGNNPVLNYVNNVENQPEATVLCTPQQSLNCVSGYGRKLLPIEETPRVPTYATSELSGVKMLPPSAPRKILFHALSDNGVSSRCSVGGDSPSFGLLPIVDTTPCSDQALPSPTATESGDQRGLAKRVSSFRAQVGQLMSRKESPLQQSKPLFSQSSNTSNAANIASPTSPTTIHRSTRLFSNSNSVKENNKNPKRGKFITPKSPTRKPKLRNVKLNLSKTTFVDVSKTSYADLQNEKNRGEKMKAETVTSEKVIVEENAGQQAILLQKQSAEGLMLLLRQLGQAYLHLAQYNCKKALELFNSLPPKHYNTGWVLCVMGKAHFELAEYQMAKRFFSEARNLEPYRCQLMEVYSTVLWHLQKEVALSALAQDLMSQDRNSPETWCAAGNCFSLQKEHDTAIKFFQRAIQVDPTFAYAYTLLGHEYVMTEELDKGMSCFRNAIRIDPRHYNAWYGEGTVYSKQEQYSLAELHYNRALAINPRNSVLMCHVGVALQAQRKTAEALKALSSAIAIDPKNPVCKYHRAIINFEAGNLEEALKELEEVKEIAPKESLVHDLIGKVHKEMGNTHSALMHFSWAHTLTQTFRINT